MKRLKEKVAIVSGAARGIGEAIARAFVTEGAFVFAVTVHTVTATKKRSRSGP